MKFVQTGIADLIVIEPVVHGDARGFFLETYRADLFEANGLPTRFVQDNHSRSVKGTLRGLHFQNPHTQGKLVRVVQGEVFDVAVDIRVWSPTFGKWCGTMLSAENKRMMFVPEGFAHGFCVTSETAEFLYKCTDFYEPESEHGIAWNDPDLAVTWPGSEFLLSAKDKTYPNFRSLPKEILPVFRGTK